MISNRIIWIFSFILIIVSCKKENESQNDKQKVYKEIWIDFKNNYPAFQENNINWDSIYNVYYPKLSVDISDKEFFNILNSTILALKDAHSDIISSQYGSTDYYNVFIKQKPANYISWVTIGTKYIDVQFNNNQNIAYGKIKNQDIGYYFVASFFDDKVDYSVFKQFINKYKDSKGIIIDLRQNSGGNSNNGKIIASYLTSETVVFQYERFSNGKSGLGDFITCTLSPEGDANFKNKIILLTNRRTFSAAENVALMLRSLPNVIHIGDTTFGGVASNVVNKTLSNGWSYRMPSSIEYDNKKISIKGGIAPNAYVGISKSDSISGNDKIIEKAVELINE